MRFSTNAHVFNNVGRIQIWSQLNRPGCKLRMPLKHLDFRRLRQANSALMSWHLNGGKRQACTFRFQSSANQLFTDPAGARLSSLSRGLKLGGAMRSKTL